MTPKEVNQSAPGLIESILGYNFYQSNKKEGKEATSMMKCSNRNEKVLEKA